ncbi:MAG TPA: hypothetical protein DCE56_13100 [Cyanobacteria bacterium UBA8553]|nr:hypothetical protein [Cyanobacteria bacterium UBA8553]HAJ60928.1 hypothetical protein [Cyanobacteria bacterium UBA8543]
MSVYSRFIWGIILTLISVTSTISLASAETKEQNLLLNSDGTQSFNVLIRSAQDLAKTSIEQEFTENPEVNEVSLTISTEHNGQIVPILHAKVTRSQWQKDSRLNRWTKYFNSSGVLLGFYTPSVSPTPQLSPRPVIVPRRLRQEKDPAFRDD